MKDIAVDLGVSLMTVSKALRSHKDIGEKTRALVVQRARELGYRPNWIARSLVTQRTDLVGLVVPDLMHSFFAEVVTGVAKRLEPLNYHVVIANSNEDVVSEARQVELLVARKCDGIILASAQPAARGESIRILEEHKTPYVLVDRRPRGLEAHYVGVKNEEIGVLATSHLIERGCRRIAHIRGPEIPTGVGRLTGYRSALNQHRMKFRPDYVVTGQHSDAAGYQAMRELLRLRPLPDGVFCYNDPVAAGAMKAILEVGLRVPGDIAVIGAGNVHYSDLLRVPLSTIDQSSSLIGETAAELLLECLNSKNTGPFRSVFIEPRLIVRESSFSG